MTKTTQAYTRNTAPAGQESSRLVRLLSEARWLALVVSAVYLVLIFLTYSKADPGWSHATEVAKLENWGGSVGAAIADLMLFVFGFSAWWWCVMLLRSVWCGYRRLSDRFFRQIEPEPKHPQETVIRSIGFVLLMTGS